MTSQHTYRRDSMPASHAITTSARTIRRLFQALLALGMVLLLAACGGTPALSQKTATYAVELQLDSLAVGDRTATVQIRDQSGQPVEAEQVILSPTMLSMGMASPEVTAKPNGGGRYTGEKLLISMTGDWELDVKIQHGGNSETARFLFTVPTQ